MSTVTTSDNSIKYGWRYGGNQGITVPATSADYLNRRGSCFVNINDGVARTCASTDTTVDGWLMMGKETTHGQAIALTGGDYFVINDPTAVFECPVDERTASLAVTAIGESCFPYNTGSTTTYRQVVKLSSGSCATPVLLIEDVDVANKTVYVRINPAKYHVT